MNLLQRAQNDRLIALLKALCAQAALTPRTAGTAAR